MTDHTKLADNLRNRLKLQHINTRNDFAQRFTEAHQALKDVGIDLEKLRLHSSKLVATGALAGTLALNAHNPIANKMPPSPPHEIMERAESHPVIPALSPSMEVRASFKEILPEEVRPLNQQEEKYLEQIIKEKIGVNAKATLEGEHLNTTYGKIGAEQHLLRYPGDTLANHAPEAHDYGGDNPQEILKEGIAPGKGAWGYFANSKEALTEDLEETERWYSVAQTLYLPDWNTRQPYLKNWYKHRKLLIINTDNGKAVVTSLSDSGPAAFTGKHFGGSPEVMDYLGGARYKKGPVLVFFVDDPKNEVKLGPVEYDK